MIEIFQYAWLHETDHLVFGGNTYKNQSTTKLQISSIMIYSVTDVIIIVEYISIDALEHDGKKYIKLNMLFGSLRSRILTC